VILAFLCFLARVSLCLLFKLYLENLWGVLIANFVVHCFPFFLQGTPFDLFMLITVFPYASCPASAQVIVIMVRNQAQAQSVLYGPNGAVSGMSLRARNILA